MPPPLSDGQVDYADGAPPTVDQYAKDVAAFLMWAAEPHLEARKRIGFQVMIFLLVFAGLLYFTKKKVWASALTARSADGRASRRCSRSLDQAGPRTPVTKSASDGGFREFRLRG